MHECAECAACDRSVLQWNLIARKAIVTLWDSIPEMNLEIGICIEAVEDGEMPEQILGCVQVKKPSWGMATEHSSA